MDTRHHGAGSDKLLTSEELAERLGVPLQTTYNWRTTGKGPRAIKVGRHLRYRAEDVNAWLEQHADPAPAA